MADLDQFSNQQNIILEGIEILKRNYINNPKRVLTGVRFEYSREANRTSITFVYAETANYD
jgi:hypothetical protein